jgi:hypothetical protein
MVKRSHTELWQFLIDEAMEAEFDAEMARTLALTPEELDNELRAAGFDVEAQKAKTLAWLEKLERGEIPTGPAARAGRPGILARPKGDTPKDAPEPEAGGAQGHAPASSR